MSKVRSLIGGEHSIAINASNTVGVMSVDRLVTNQTRRSTFDTELLVEWAQAVDEAYGGHVEIVFAPGRPLLAVEGEADDPTLGIGLAERRTD